MKAVILSGGQGTRLRPLTYTTPKQLIPIAGKPVLGHVIDSILEAGLTEIAIVTSPESEHHISAFLERSRIATCRPEVLIQAEPRGLAHALATALPWVGDESILLYLGDCLITGGIGHMVEQHVETDAGATLLVRQVTDPSRYGIVELDGHGRIARLVEKPPNSQSNLAIVGVYAFSPEIASAVHRVGPSWRDEYEITDAIQILADEGGKVMPADLRGWWIDTGTVEDVFTANELLMSDMEGDDSSLPGTVVEGAVRIGRGADIRDSVLRGPLVIGEDVQVHDSEVGGNTSLGSGCRILGSKIDGSILMDGVEVRSAFLSRTMLGPESRILGEGVHTSLTLVAGAETLFGSDAISQSG